MKKRFFVVAAIIFSSQLHAQQDSIATPLDEVVLTANKYPRKQSETGKVITIITRQQLEKSAGRTLNELLNSVAGTTIIGANNNLGTNQTASLRGASAGNALILVDGIPVNDPSVISNYFDLNFINIDQVERIEILKGGQSTLYGSDAVSGVINIITKKTVPAKWTVNGGFTVGSYQTMKENLGVAGKLGKSTISVDYTHVGSDGFSAAYDSSKTGAFDNDGYEQHVVNGRVNLPLAKKLSTSLFGSYSVYDADLDWSAFTDDRDYSVNNKNIQSGLGLNYKLKNGNVYFNYNFNRAERDYADDSVHKSNPFAYYSRSSYVGRTHFAEIYGNWQWEEYELLAGVDYRENNTEQSYFSTGMFGPYESPDLKASMKQVSPYASLIIKLEALQVEAGARWNNHSEYGNNVTFTFNPSLLVAQNTRLFVNLYSAFKAPTLYQLFDPMAGNPDLTREQSLVAEAGVSFNKRPFSGRVTGFYRKTEDVILYTYDPATFNSKYINASEQVNYGTELEVSYTSAQVSVHANYTFTDGETTAGFDGTGSPLAKDTTYFNLYRIPKHAVNLNLGFQFTRNIYAAARLHAVSEREEFVYGSFPAKLDGYNTIDLYGEYKFEKHIRVFIDLKNITDREYFDILGYTSRKFNFTTGVQFQF